MSNLTLTSCAAGVVLVALGASRAGADDAIPRGQQIFAEYKCTQCHSIDSLKIAKVKSHGEDDDEADEGGKKLEPPDLSGIGNEAKADFIVKWLKKEEAVDGHKHKKKFKGSEEDLHVLADWLGTLKYNVPKKKSK